MYFFRPSMLIRTYETKDGKYMAVGALEPKFNLNLFNVLGMGSDISEVYSDPAGTTAKMEGIFKSKTRDEWTELFKGKDACVTPVLDLDDCGTFGHNKGRGTFSLQDGKWIPNAAPKYYTKEEFKKLKANL